ncbi:MAG: hypothetical protein WC365_08555 [Candidatus Babeliales bacterium]|jgi:hypothetical protein
MIQNPLKAIRNWLESRKTFYTLNYHGTRLKLPYPPRTGVCEVCGKHSKTNRHHFWYAFTRKQVMEKPDLGMLYTAEMCGFWPCHEMGNSIRKLIELDPEIKITSKNSIIKTIFAMQEKAIAQCKKDGNYPKKVDKNAKSTAKT